MIRWLLFDAAGTLLNIRGSVGEIYSRVGQELGIEVDRSLLQHRFEKGWKQWMERDREAPTSLSDQKSHWKNLVIDCFPEASSEVSEEIFLRLWEVFRHPPTWRIDPHLNSALRQLCEAGFHLAVASNFDDRLHDLLAGFPELHRMERVFISSEIGWSKPSPNFFRHIEQELAVSPEELLMIGDSPVHDFYPSQRCGWQAFLFDPRDLYPECHPRFHRFDELFTTVRRSTLG